jgi:hypothetical protein
MEDHKGKNPSKVHKPVRSTIGVMEMEVVWNSGKRRLPAGKTCGKLEGRE